jgi:hypothetical protein
MRCGGFDLAGYINPFISTHVPILWNALVREFGRDVDYWIDNDPAQAVTITLIWKDGAEDETMSPGRYSHVLVANSDLPRDPKLGDAIVNADVQYDIVRISAFAYNYSQIVLQDRSEDF